MAEIRSETPTTNPAPMRDRVQALRLPPVEERSGSSLNWLLGLIVATLIAGGAWYWWQNIAGQNLADAPTTPQTPNSTSKSPANTDTPATTKSAPPTAEESKAGLVLESKGYIIPAHRILVSPKVSGMLIELNVEEGMRVKKGDVLGIIESIEYNADVKRAEASLELADQRALELDNGSRPEEIQQAEAELDESRAKLAQLEADYVRAERLVKIGGVTQAEFDEITATRTGQRRRIDRLTFVLKLLNDGPRKERKAQAHAEVEQYRAELTKAKWRLENCTIRAPISGTILKKNAEEGNIVNPIAFNGSYSLCDMADLSDLEVDLNIQERDVSRVFKGQKCKVRVEAYPDRVYEGYVSRLMPIADRAKGAVPVRVKVTVPSEEEGVYLKPDMGAIVSFYGRAEATPVAASER